MISTRRYYKAQGQYKVTFKLPEGMEVEEASVVGEFNNWDPTADPMKKSKGEWKATVDLDPGTEYQYRFYVNGGEWLTDDEADKYVVNEHGTQNSVVVLPERDD